VTDRQSKEFKANLTRDDDKRIIVSGPVEGPSCCSIDELHSTMEGLRIQCAKENRGRAQKWLEGLAKSAQRYAPALDVIAQSQPDVTAVIWGALRFLIVVRHLELLISHCLPAIKKPINALFNQIIVANVEAYEKVKQTIGSIVVQVGRWKIELQQFEDSERVQTAISILFAHILNYVVNVISLSRKSRIVQFLKAASGWSTRKLDSIYSDIKEQELIVDRELRTAREKSDFGGTVPKQTFGLTSTRSVINCLFEQAHRSECHD
jgi:hypothetical protein